MGTHDNTYISVQAFLKFKGFFMADVVLPVVGAAVGFAQGGPQGAMIGM
jgi:hypothetical protein